jgi:4-hydroxythreonine-4-phosphate dehydrogenase
MNRIAIAIGDPAGIGPEIAIKAALDAKVRAVCAPCVVGDLGVIERHARACGLDIKTLAVIPCPLPEATTIPFGATSPIAGRASIAFCRAAVQAALQGEVDAVVGAPQNETSVAQAGIPFDGHPSFVARQTGSDPDDVYMMLACGEMKIAHATLHTSVRKAIEAITQEKVTRVIEATDRALKRLGIAAPRIAVSGLNPHAGEGGLFGSEEIEIIKPAIEAAAARGIGVTGPFGADTMFHMAGIDAFIVMLHDQGHVAAKLLSRHATVAFTIGTPILFASVAHGSAHDIAGKGIADPSAMIEAVLRLSKARVQTPV